MDFPFLIFPRRKKENRLSFSNFLIWKSESNNKTMNWTLFLKFPSRYVSHWEMCVSVAPSGTIIVFHKKTTGHPNLWNPLWGILGPYSSVLLWTETYSISVFLILFIMAVVLRLLVNIFPCQEKYESSQFHTVHLHTLDSSSPYSSHAITTKPPIFIIRLQWNQVSDVQHDDFFMHMSKKYPSHTNTLNYWAGNVLLQLDLPFKAFRICLCHQVPGLR
jgi:hypothetical protein